MEQTGIIPAGRLLSAHSKPHMVPANIRILQDSVRGQYKAPDDRPIQSRLTSLGEEAAIS